MTPLSTVKVLDERDIWDIRELTRTLTPAEARELLKMNTDNRSQRRNTIDRIKRDIARGGYMLNGDTIVISTDGVLLNGQHRLEAIAEGTTTVEVIILKGVDPAAFSTIDNHRPRSLSDYFKIHGEADHTRVSQLATRAERWDNNLRGSDIGAGSKRRTDQEYLDYFESNKDSLMAAIRSPQKYDKITPSIVSIFRYIVGSELANECDEYLREVTTGVPSNPNKTSTIRVSKIKDAITNIYHSDDSRNKNHRILGTLIVGWNKTREGKTINKNPFDGGALPEPVLD